MQHSFEVDIAKEYGILEAVLLSHFRFWLAKNKANNRNYYDGDYWTYNSTKAFAELFPYASKRQIEKALMHLREENIIKVGNYNEFKYDRTLWYALTEKGKSILQFGDFHITKRGNGNRQSVTPIPDINTDNNTDINTDKNILLFSEIIDYLNNRAGTNYKASTKQTQSLINARLKDGFTIDDFKTVIDNKCTEWLGDEKMQDFLRPVTLFGTKFESYLNSKVTKRQNFQNTVNKPASDYDRFMAELNEV